MRLRIFLSRRSLGEGGCSMKIAEDVRKYAAEHGLSETEAIEHGLKEKSREFVEQGSEVYAKP
jgi:phosphomethylpyrimidine synthase